MIFEYIRVRNYNVHISTVYHLKSSRKDKCQVRCLG